MAHGYRTLQRWDQWLMNHFLGSVLLQEEGKLLPTLLNKHPGKNALLIGVPSQSSFLKEMTQDKPLLMSPPIHHHHQDFHIESDLHELPIQSGSVDLVIIPHTLEFVDHPRHLFSEACRIVKPEGLIAIVGFNPYSPWGIKNIFAEDESSAFTSHMIHAQKIKGWLKLADFAIEQHHSFLFRPPLSFPTLQNKLTFLEKIGPYCFSPFGGAYVLIARAKVIPLTPIKMKWKQELSNISMPSAISGHI